MWGSRVADVREALTWPPEQRTQKHVDDILECVKDIKFFPRIKQHLQRELCTNMTLETFNSKEMIFRKDDPGDKFYIILDGNVNVLIAMDEAAAGDYETEEKQICLGKGCTFGELALQSETSLRSATIQAMGFTECLVITRADYEKYASQDHKQFIEQRVRYLRQCPRIENALREGHVELHAIKAMANCLSEHTYTANSMVVKQGEAVEHIIFVKSGQLTMLRVVAMDDVRRETARLEEARKAKKSKPKEGSLSVPQSLASLPSGSIGPRDDRRLQARADCDVLVDDTASRAPFPINLARAIMDMRKRDRNQLLDNMGSSRTTPARSPSSPRASAVVVPQMARRPVASPLAPEASLHDKTTSITTATPASGLRNVQLSGKLGNGGCTAVADDSSAKTETLSPRWKKLSSSVKQASIVSRIDEWAPKMAVAEEAGEARLGMKRKLLRVGNVGAFQFFGDRQVYNNDVYPVSLVSDSVAEIYMMSKHDILRKLPKKLFSALFTPEKDMLPSDVQLCEMHKQSQRWIAFRRGLHEDAIGRSHGSHPPRSSGRVDIAANLDFLGINPHSALGASLQPRPRDQSGTALKARDEQFFSQASAQFLRRFENLRRDKGLKRALAKAGMSRDLERHEQDDEEGVDKDPVVFLLEKNWASMRKDALGLDVADEPTDLFELGFAGSRGSSRVPQSSQGNDSGTAVIAANVQDGCGSGSSRVGGPTLSSSSSCLVTRLVAGQAGGPPGHLRSSVLSSRDSRGSGLARENTSRVGISSASPCPLQCHNSAQLHWTCRLPVGRGGVASGGTVGSGVFGRGAPAHVSAKTPLGTPAVLLPPVRLRAGKAVAFG